MRKIILLLAILSFGAVNESSAEEKAVSSDDFYKIEVTLRIDGKTYSKTAYQNRREEELHRKIETGLTAKIVSEALVDRLGVILLPDKIDDFYRQVLIDLPDMGNFTASKVPGWTAVSEGIVMMEEQKLSPFEVYDRLVRKKGVRLEAWMAHCTDHSGEWARRFLSYDNNMKIAMLQAKLSRINAPKFFLFKERFMKTLDEPEPEKRAQLYRMRLMKEIEEIMKQLPAKYQGPTEIVLENVLELDSRSYFSEQSLQYFAFAQSN